VRRELDLVRCLVRGLKIERGFFVGLLDGGKGSVLVKSRVDLGKGWIGIVRLFDGGCSEESLL